jgi:YbbR-like protein
VTAKSTWRELLRAALFENVGLKVLSLLCALGLYAYIHGAGDNAQRTFSVGVVVLRPPDSANRELLTQPPTEVGVTVRGSRTQLDDLHTDDLGSVRVDLRSGHESRVDLDPSMIPIPTGLTVEQIIPSSIEVRWDDVVVRPIPVQIARTGEPAAGFVVKSIAVVEPQTVQARGPRSVVDVMQFARAVPFDVTDKSEGTFQRPLALDKPPKLVTFDVESVIAKVEIARELIKKEYPRLKVEIVGVPRGTATPATVTVAVTGTPENVNAILPEGIVPRVEPKSAGLDTSVPGSAYLDVLVDLPKVKVEVRPARVLAKW